MICGYFNSSYIAASRQGSIHTWAAIGLHIGFGFLAAMFAKLFQCVRETFYKDKSSNIDTDFDAGGKVTIGLTATTIVSQWTWAATLLQSSSVAAKYGISGPLWYASGASIQIVLFSIISAQLKVRAPGAKTFLQVVKARFGTRTHLVYCAFALLTNIVVTGMLTLGGAAVMKQLVPGLSVEYATGLVAAVIGTYTFMGGLGATFYVSYINTATIFILIVVFCIRVFHNPSGEFKGLGTIEAVFAYTNCVPAPEGNAASSYFTILSNSGLMFGFINIVGNFGTVFVDQSYWQSSVAAKPKEGVWGFLLGGLCWFAVPFTFATAMGLGYLASCGKDGHFLLPPEDIEAGLVAPAVARRVMGASGEFMICVMILMTVTSTGSAEVIAVTSILVYDIYQIYLKPFRLVHDANSCILCGQARGRQASLKDTCKCHSMSVCANCERDDIARSDCRRAIKPGYRCPMHGGYREYNDYLALLKNWCIVWCTMAIVPLTMFLDELSIKLGWLYLVMGILIGSAVIPIILCMCWSRLTGPAMMAGALIGMPIAIITWLSVASTYPGGLSNFMANTGSEFPMLWGNIVAIFGGGIVSVVITLIMRPPGRFGKAQSIEAWEVTRDIDNPLGPWTELYGRELNIEGAYKLDNRPSLETVSRTFRDARLTSYIGAPIVTFIIVILWPLLMTTVQSLSVQQFTHWVNSAIAWAILGAAIMLILPVANEIWDIIKQRKEEVKVSDVKIEADRAASRRKHIVTTRQLAVNRNLEDAPTFDTSKIDPVWDGEAMVEDKTGAAPVTPNTTSSVTTDTPDKNTNTVTSLKEKTGQI